MWMSAGKTPLPVIFLEAIYCWKKKWASWSINSIMQWRTSFPLTICQKYSHSGIQKWPVICPKQEQIHPGNMDEPGPVSTEGFFPAHGSASQRAAKQSHGETLANTPAQCGHICACPVLSRARLGTCMEHTCIRIDVNALCFGMCAWMNLYNTCALRTYHMLLPSTSGKLWVPAF